MRHLLPAHFLRGVERAARFVSLHTNLRGFEPVIVYQMAKVGSTAVVEALAGHGLPVFHVHRMNPEHLERMRETRRTHGWFIPPVPYFDRLGLRLYEKVIRRGHRARIVTLAREPIARNLSSYFEHLDAIWKTEDAHLSIPVEMLCSGFAERFTHLEPLTWFEDEMLPVLGIDIYDQPFGAEGHRTIRTDQFDVLILKTEISDEIKSAALSRFFGIEDIVVRRSNETSLKLKGAAFLQFAAAIRLSTSYVDEMLNARYTRHFYSQSERDALRQRYLS